MRKTAAMKRMENRYMKAEIVLHVTRLLEIEVKHAKCPTDQTAKDSILVRHAFSAKLDELLPD